MQTFAETAGRNLNAVSEESFAMQLVEGEKNYRSFKRLVSKSGKNLRQLLEAQTEEVECESEENIREYLKNKSVVVLATSSFVEEEFKEANNNQIHRNLYRLADKRLDFKYHKNMKV